MLKEIILLTFYQFKLKKILANMIFVELSQFEEENSEFFEKITLKKCEKFSLEWLTQNKQLELSSPKELMEKIISMNNSNEKENLCDVCDKSVIVRIFKYIQNNLKIIVLFL